MSECEVQKDKTCLMKSERVTLTPSLKISLSIGGLLTLKT
jgi:hypothetical protein